MNIPIHHLEYCADYQRREDRAAKAEVSAEKLLLDEKWISQEYLRSEPDCLATQMARINREYDRAVRGDKISMEACANAWSIIQRDMYSFALEQEMEA